MGCRQHVYAFRTMNHFIDLMQATTIVHLGSLKRSKIFALKIETRPKRPLPISMISRY